MYYSYHKSKGGSSMIIVSVVSALLSLCYLLHVCTLRVRKVRKGYYVCNRAYLQIGCHISIVILLLSVILYCISIISGTVQ